jgi:hypothetical protein
VGDTATCWAGCCGPCVYAWCGASVCMSDACGAPVCMSDACGAPVCMSDACGAPVCMSDACRCVFAGRQPAHIACAAHPASWCSKLEALGLRCISPHRAAGWCHACVPHTRARVPHTRACVPHTRACVPHKQL